MAKKLYYKIGEACKILEIQPYVLRYWETEFQALSPSKSKSGQRVYSADDLELIRRIKELLYEEGYTIAGAKKKLESEVASRPKGVEASEADEPAEEADGDAAEEPPKELAAEAKKPAAKPRARKPASKPKAAPKRAAKPADRQATQRAKRLEKGIREALADIKEILQILDSN